MTDRSSDPDAPFLTRLRLARAALLWERVWPACWPALAVLASFLVLGLFDLLPLLPGPLHTVLLLGSGAAIVVALAVITRRIVLPDRMAARRRLEEASGLEHRPLQALADRPITALDPQAAQLWQAHRQRMEAATRRLRIGFPAAGLAGIDPFGLRAVLAMPPLIGAIDAGVDWRDRLMRALTPPFSGGSPALAASLDIWITPPEYTGFAPQFLRPKTTETIRVPTGSALLAQVHGGSAIPRLAIDGEGHISRPSTSKTFGAAATLTSGKQLKVSQADTTLASWQIEIVPDNPPKITFAKPPTATPRAALRIDYQASDDYGVEGIRAVIRRDGGKPDETLEFEAPLPEPAP